MHEGDRASSADPGPVAGSLSGAELRGRRQALGLTQAQLADRLGVSATVVARWERGQQRIGQPDRVRAVLGELEISGVESPARNLQLSDLPRELTTFVGREHGIAEVAHLLPSARLLTLTIRARGVFFTRSRRSVVRRK